MQSASKEELAGTEADNCALCEKVFGKRLLRPRHHCRICCRSVCGACSPSTVRLQEVQQLQRVCSQCVAHILNADMLRERILQLGVNLKSITSKQQQGQETTKSLVQAVYLCEEALKPFQVMCEEFVQWVDVQQDSLEVADLMKSWKDALNPVSNMWPSCEQARDPHVEEPPGAPDADKCHRCSLVFGVWHKRKHSCRMCGESVCASCSSDSVYPGSSQSKSICICSSCTVKGQEVHALRYSVARMANSFLAFSSFQGSPLSREDSLFSPDLRHVWLTSIFMCELALVPLKKFVLLHEKMAKRRLMLNAKKTLEGPGWCSVRSRSLYTQEC